MSKPYTLEDTINFGRKHRGTKIVTVIDKDASYVEWALENVTNFELDKEGEEYLIDALEDLA